MLGCTGARYRAGLQGCHLGQDVAVRGQAFAVEAPCVISEKDIKAKGWLVLFRCQEKLGRFMPKLFGAWLLPLSFGFIAGG